VGIGHAVAERLRADGWEVVTVGWRPYDARMTWGADPEPLADHDADFADPAVPARLVETVRRQRGPLTALVLCHCESVDSSILDTTVESFDRHMAVNARAVCS
jgi:3-oxoacyl-[acyl-carrier protein] reductase